MVRKIKKKTLFFAGMIGLSLLSLFGMRNHQAEVLSESDLRDLLGKTPRAYADTTASDGPAPTAEPDCPAPSDGCPG